MEHACGTCWNNNNNKCPQRQTTSATRTEKCPCQFPNHSNRNDKLLQHECEITLDRTQRKSNALRNYGDRAKLLSAHMRRSQYYGKRVGARATQPTEREISPSFSAASSAPAPDPSPTLSLLLQKERIYCSSTVALWCRIRIARSTTRQPAWRSERAT